MLPIYLPPLRERREDIPLLVEHFMKKNTGDKHDNSVPARVMARLMAYDWPGNVRELQNVIRRYAIFGELKISDKDEKTVVIEPLLTDIDPNDSLPERLAKIEQQMIIDCLEKNHWHRGQTATQLGIDSKTLYRKLKAHGIK